jgi:GH35 family endo-1,4-beta-xylanase
MLCFGLGFLAQTVEIGGLECLNYEKKVKLTDLPRTKATYAGREADAAWRKEADERIEKYRKGVFKVFVTDAAGKPVENAQVKVSQSKHAFGFGTAVGAYHLAEHAGVPWNGPLPKGLTSEQQKEMTEKYATQIKKLFNKVTPENDLKWQGWLGKPDERTNKEKTLKALAWLKENGIEARGHVLVWPSFKNSPAFLRDLRTDKAKLAEAILNHIKEEAAATKDLVSEFDVLNEPFDNKDFMNILGQDAMVDWFKAARDALGPNVKTFINDFDILETGGVMDTPHQKAYYDTIKFLIDKGAPLDGIGFQSHFSKTLTPPATSLKILDRFAEFNKILQITEFDVNTPDEELQADYTRDFLTIAFSHPSVNSFTMWGFWENKHWIPAGAMYRKDWSLKPNAKVYEDLVFKKWWTTADGKTAADGSFRARGFFGEYEIEVTANGKTVKSKGKLTADETPVTVKLE